MKHYSDMDIIEHKSREFKGSTKMVGTLSSGWIRRALLFLVLVTGTLLIAMFTYSPSLVSLQPFIARRIFQSPWSWACVSGRCERRIVRSSRISLATCSALCGDNTRLLWPRPNGPVHLGMESLAFHWQQIKFATVNTSSHDIEAFFEYAKDIFLRNVRNLMRSPTPGIPSAVDNFVIYLSANTAKDAQLTLNTDESYQLQVLTKNRQLEVRIVGKSYYGVRHGLETFSQMIWWDENCGRHGCLRALSQASIEDKPAFAYRGLLVDSGRQFFSIDQLKSVIDGMAASKLNTFHWHLTDSQSFPYNSVQFPEMARWGAYSSDDIYSPDDIKDLSSYAKVRGVRVLVEIDSPAHAGAGWQWGFCDNIVAIVKSLASVCRMNSCEKLGLDKTSALVRACLLLLKADYCSTVHYHFTSQDMSFVREDCFLGVSTEYSKIGLTLSRLILGSFPLITYPIYFTSLHRNSDFLRLVTRFASVNALNTILNNLRSSSKVSVTVTVLGYGCNTKFFWARDYQIVEDLFQFLLLRKVIVIIPHVAATAAECI
ncbi:probable beta-hexosaminidase fdl [Copidosoma floridanum]|uniref:probable beta-hexosaminidase fdl n=1 Tax=Copidosoma floridanum TaxID=29053 RepID=UPI0006C95109|nr:probable beta-hexosaminidase fdl [Copidosoma floridanum]